MHTLTVLVALTGTSLLSAIGVAQDPPRPPTPPTPPTPPRVETPTPPARAARPMKPLPPMGRTLLDAWEPALAPSALWDMDLARSFAWEQSLLSGQEARLNMEQRLGEARWNRDQQWDQSLLSGTEARLNMEQRLGEARWNMDQQLVEARQSLDLARDQWPLASELTTTLSGLAALAPIIATTVPRAWAPNDQADSAYRQARELLNQGEYRRAAAAFRDITAKSPTSPYAADALYWQAFAMYRIGGTPDLRGALDALDLQRAKYAGSRTQAETEALAIRIRGALAARGDAAAAAIIRSAAGDSALRCDREEQSVRAEALNALAQSDPAGALPLLQKVLARKDECSVMLRRTAVFLMGSKQKDAAAVNTLSQVAKTDPSYEVRTSAMEWLARVPGEEALGTLEELSRDSDERVSRAAVRALVSHPSPRARTFVRAVVERSETPERLRLEALSAFDKERTTSDDVAWMRALYGRTENSKIKTRIVNTLSNIGGPEVDQWMLALARNADENSDTRRSALRRVGKTLPIADLARLYDSAAERNIREALIETLATRTEAEATDKLIDVVKTGTDPRLRSQAISALTRKKDPRTMRLLMEIIDK